MKKLTSILAVAAVTALSAVSGCAAQLTFIDRTTGLMHVGISGGTAGYAGNATATIDGVKFSGPWVFDQYKPKGGRMNLIDGSGKFIRCFFDFQPLESSGSGECTRNDGRKYDLFLSR